MACRDKGDANQKAVEPQTHVTRAELPPPTTCLYCGEPQHGGLCANEQCPGRRGTTITDIQVGADTDLTTVWARYPEPPPQRIIRGAWPTPEPVWAVLEALRDHGGRPYYVGGVNRDRVLAWLYPERFGHLRPKDWDVEVHGLSPEQIVEIVAPLGPYKIKGERFGVIEIYLPGGISVEVAPARKESRLGIEHQAFLVSFDDMSLQEAALRRDVRYAAMCGDPWRGEIYDFFGGVADLEKGVIRHTSPAFAEDVGRPWRLMSQSARFDMPVDTETIALAHQLLPDFLQLTPGQQKGVLIQEWNAWALKSLRPSRALEFLVAAGWHESLPEIAALVHVPPELAHLDRPVAAGELPHGIPQDRSFHPEGGVLKHTAWAVEAAKKVADRDELHGDDRKVLMYYALLHDTGKDTTTVVEADGKVASPNHAAEGVARVHSFLERIGESKALADRVASLVRFHMDYMNYQPGARRHVVRRARDLQAVGESLTMLARAVEVDNWARPPYPQGLAAESPGLPPQMQGMLDLAKQLQVERVVPPDIVTGRVLLDAEQMAAYGLPPMSTGSAFMGQVVRAARAAQATGAFADLAGGLQWLREHFRVPDAGPWPRRGRMGGKARSSV